MESDPCHHISLACIYNLAAFGIRPLPSHHDHVHSLCPSIQNQTLVMTSQSLILPVLQHSESDPYHCISLAHTSDIAALGIRPWSSQIYDARSLLQHGKSDPSHHNIPSRHHSPRLVRGKERLHTDSWPLIWLQSLSYCVWGIKLTSDSSPLLPWYEIQ